METISDTWRKLSSDLKKRRAVLARLWMPVGLPLTALLFVGWAYEFVRSHGALTLPAAGLLVLAVVVLLAAPVHGIRVSALRILAFITDLALLALLTFSLLWLLRASGGRIDGPGLMVVAWLWFFYFVIWDCSFGGTAGKKFFGLRLTTPGRAGRIGFLRCVIRTSAMLLLPLFLATMLSDLFEPTASPFRFCTTLTLRQAILAFMPISILVLGGNQGIVDQLLSTQVVTRHGSTPASRSLRSQKTWAILVGSTLSWGILVAWLGYLSFGRSAFDESALPPPSERFTFYWVSESPEAIATLWQHLPRGLGDPQLVLSKITIRVARPNPFTIDATRTASLPSWAKEFNSLPQVQVIRLSFQPGASLLTKLQVIGNLGELAASQTVQPRSQYVVVETGMTGDFGFFFTEFYESFLLRAAGTDTAYGNLVSRVSVGGKVSLDRARWLLTGDWYTLPP